MRIDGWLRRTGRALRRWWTSVAAGGLALIVIALCPLPAEGQSALVDLGGAGLGGEIVEKGIRLAIWGIYKGLRWARETFAAPPDDPEGG